MNFALGAYILSGVVPIYLYGTEEQKEKFLPSLSNGTKIIANAISEAQSGSDAFNMKSNAIKTGHNYILNGSKVYCSSAPVSNYVITYLVTNAEKGMFGGITAFVLERIRGTMRLDNLSIRWG